LDISLETAHGFMVVFNSSLTISVKNLFESWPTFLFILTLSHKHEGSEISSNKCQYALLVSCLATREHTKSKSKPWQDISSLDGVNTFTELT